MPTQKKYIKVPFCDSNQLEWHNAVVITEFTDPWKGIDNSPMEVRVFHSKLGIHIKFIVKETSPTIFGSSSDKMGVTISDRVEVFFASNKELNPYYCLEIDASGRVLDYQAKYHRHFDYSWNWPKGEIKVNTCKTNEFYQVSITLSKQSLLRLGLLYENKLLCGFYRGKPVGVDQFEWYTWLNPKTSSPDFHVPNTFGLLNL